MALLKGRIGAEHSARTGIIHEPHRPAKPEQARARRSLAVGVIVAIGAFIVTIAAVGAFLGVTYAVILGALVLARSGPPLLPTYAYSRSYWRCNRRGADQASLGYSQ